MKTIICRESKQAYYGNVVGTVSNSVNKHGEIIQYWLFETQVDGEYVVWECHSDYWELVDSDLRKVSKALKIEEETKPSIMDTIKQILKRGYCK